MFARLQLSPQNVPHLERVEALVRTRFGLGEDHVVLVREEVGAVPGLPARATVVLFWTGAQVRHRFRIFKPADAVAECDLPASWLQSAIRDEGDIDCC